MYVLTGLQSIVPLTWISLSIVAQEWFDVVVFLHGDDIYLCFMNTALCAHFNAF